MQTITLNFTSREHAATAYHEAGHVVMARRLGLPVRSVSIVGDEESKGRVEHYPGSKPRLRLSDFTFDARTRNRYEKLIMMLWAGPLTEHQSGYAAEDTDDLVYGAWSDLDQIDYLAALMTLSEPEAKAYKTWLRMRTLTIMDNELDYDFWPSVRIVVAALCENPYLSARRIRAILL